MLTLRINKMPDFYTPVAIPSPLYNIDYTSKLLFMGSCFADHMGKQMQELKFKVCHNPFGVIYNPQSMAQNLMLLMEKDKFSESDLNFFNELWFSYSHYTLFSDPDKSVCLENINEQFKLAKESIIEAKILFITLGTSWVFRRKDNREVVNNCHKIPADKFDRYFSTVQQTVDSLSRAINMVRKANPSVKVILTVSPVRHWKDGAIENQRSKSALILSIAELQETLSDIYYFPSYEIFMDELRDYRFYAVDKLHPSEEAQKYIWEKFRNAFLTEGAKEISITIEKILSSVKHNPRFPSTQSHKKFLDKTTSRINILRQKYPFLDFSQELGMLNLPRQ